MDRPTPNASRALFLPCSPYHLVLTAALIGQRRLTRAEVVFVDDTGFAKFVPGVASFFDGHDLVVLDGRKPGLRQVANAYRARYSGGRPWDQVDQVFVFNDSRADVQAIVNRVSPRAKYHAVEDGLEAYVDRAAVDTRSYNRKLAQLAYKWYKNVENFGEYRESESFYMLWPELARPTIPMSKRRAIDHRSFAAASARFEALCNSNVKAKFGAVLLASHSESVSSTDGYLNFISDLVAVAQSINGSHVAVKLHPREDNVGYIQKVSAIRDIQLMPKHLPMEALASRMSQECAVLTSLTSFIFTSKVLRPDRRIFLTTSLSEAFMTQLNRVVGPLSFSENYAASSELQA